MEVLTTEGTIQITGATKTFGNSIIGGSGNAINFN
jgi:hypothetical protein